MQIKIEFCDIPNGQSSLVQKSLFFWVQSILLPGSTIVISRDSNPFDILEITRIITPILADLATSAAAIAAISNKLTYRCQIKYTSFLFALIFFFSSSIYASIEDYYPLKC